MPTKDIVFVDVETTGLDPVNDAVIQVGVLRTDITGKTVKATLDIRVKPSVAVTTEAAAVNGYTPEAWEDAVEPEEAAELLNSICKDAEFAAHCVWFDQAFCENLLRRNKYKIPWGRRLIDTQTLAHLLRAACPQMNGTSLSACAEALGLRRSAMHDALEDARLARDVYVWAYAQIAS